LVIKKLYLYNAGRYSENP